MLCNLYTVNELYLTSFPSTPKCQARVTGQDPGHLWSSACSLGVPSCPVNKALSNREKIPWQLKRDHKTKRNFLFSCFEQRPAFLFFTRLIKCVTCPTYKSLSTMEHISIVLIPLRSTFLLSDLSLALLSVLPQSEC